jgi:tape measure domain-containing protein
MNSEVIAKLVGVLQFQVDISGLQRFERGLSQARQKMMALSREADVLSKKLGTKMGIKVDSAGQEKLAKTVRANLDRELKLEQAVQRTRRATFTAELAGQKLINLRQKEGAAIQSQALRDKIAQAVLDAKAAKAEGERLKVSGAALKQAQSVEQHKARQARWEALLTQQQQKTAILRQKEFQAMTATQRAEFALQQARIRGHRTAEKFAASQEAAKLRAQRLDVSHAQKAERFQWAQTRQAAWAAKQAEPKPSTGFGAGIALGGVAGGVAAVVAALGALSERLDKRQADASESQTYRNIFAQVGGKNPANAERAEKGFAEMTEKYGMTNNAQTASDFRTFMLSQQARGVAMSKSLTTYETQLAAFRASGMSKAQQDRAVIQLQQVRSLGKADTEDVKTFTESAPLIRLAITEAWGQRTGYKGDNLDGAFMKSIPDGGVTSADFEAGFARFVSQQQEALARQMVSIDAQQTRLDNAKYLQAQEINASADLVQALGDRLAAEKELVEALGPLKQSLADFDKGLINFNTRMIRWMIGHDANGNATPNAMQKDANPTPGSVGAALGPRLRPAPLDAQGDLEDRAKPGLLNDLRRLFSGKTVEDDQATAAENRERWAGRVIDPVEPMYFDAYRLTTPNLGKDPQNLADGKMRQFRPYQPYTAQDIMEGAAAQQRNAQPAPPAYIGPGDLSPNTSSTQPSSNIDQSHTEIHVDVKVDARGMSKEEAEKFTVETAKRQWEATLRETAVNQKEVL